MKRQHLAGGLMLLCMAAVTACGPAAGQSEQSADSAVRASAGSGVSADPAGASAEGSQPAVEPEKRKKKKKKKGKGKKKRRNPILAAQIRTARYISGDMFGPRCAAALSVLPPAFATSPAVWLSDADGPKNLHLAGDSALCLHGFSAGGPITVTVSDGHRRYMTSVRPTPGTLSDRSDGESAESLFRQAPLRVYDTGNGLMESESWFLVPPSRPRENIAAARRLTISATQAGRTATYKQVVAVPHKPGQQWLWDDHGRRIVVYGFERGLRVPIGLYRRVPSAFFTSKLVRKIGTVDMPGSRTAVYSVPNSVKVPSGYCVTAPVSMLTSRCVAF
jgi:hypothetical protein